MRVAFGVIGGAFWTGGLNYLESLVSALQDRRSLGITPLLFAAPDADQAIVDRLAPYFPEPPRVSPAWCRTGPRRALRRISSVVLQRDSIAEREFRRMSADVVFQHSVWYGLRFRVPTVAWIADFQHRRCPEMFSARNRLARDIGYRMLSHSADALVLSSADALNDCRALYPHAAVRCHALPFVPRLGAVAPASALHELLGRYGLPPKFIFLPNQLWLHKNHLAVIAALELLGRSGDRPMVVACGNPEDYRHPDHPQRVIAAAASPSLRGSFRFLGMIPRADLTGLMRLSAAVINPSLSEGWSTTVEESKALGVPMLLSDIPVHREQAMDMARYFDPRSPESIAATLRAAWPELEAGPRPERESLARAAHAQARLAFAGLFAQIAASAAAQAHARRSRARHARFNASVPGR